MGDLFQDLLDYYSYSLEDYARVSGEPSFADLPRLDRDPGAIALKKRLTLAKERKEKTLIYGDYDTDGIMATSIMVRALRQFGLSCPFFIPSRYSDGYGLNLENAKKIAKGGYALVLCVDNGVSCLDAISYLKSQGIDTLVIDHHELPEVLPEMAALVHPAHYAAIDVTTSAGASSFLFARYLLGKDDPYLATLGAMSVISDCMPMLSYNAKLVGLALRILRQTPFPEISLLCPKRRIDEKTLGMEVVPLINAVGRMEKGHEAARLVHYFAEPDSDKERIANYMKEVNASRKEATKAAESRLSFDPDKPILIALGDLPEGLNGLLANKLMHEYRKPVAIWSPSDADPSLYIGSLRSEEGCNVIEAYGHCGDLLCRYGGHAYAGGASVKKEDFPALCARLEEFAAEHPFAKSAPPSIEVAPEDLSPEAYAVLRKFGPFGQDHPEPLFRISRLKKELLGFTKDGRFAQLKGPNCRFFSFDLRKEKAAALPDEISIVGTLDYEEYKGFPGYVFHFHLAEN